MLMWAEQKDWLRNKPWHVQKKVFAIGGMYTSALLKARAVFLGSTSADRQNESEKEKQKKKPFILVPYAESIKTVYFPNFNSGHAH